MSSTRLGRRVSLVIGGGAIMAMIGFTAACGSGGDEPEETTPTTTTTTTTEPPLSPTEKAPDPGGPGVFTPPVTAPQQTVNPGRDDYGQ
ncbi:hypothetical protein ACNUDN_25380 [Mycobacterium sp. smrl_JER01]|uniref:hypothetical protein n=1 Tax=Mycobacterium sp. smrl_JER01 TaxID=3402633 RepID=UPI003AC1F798